MIHQKDSLKEIIIFTRYPEPGKAKTRLIPELGAEGAAMLQRKMTEQVVRAAEQLENDNETNISVYFTGGTHQQMEHWLGSHLSCYQQVGVDLGQRMLHAFQDAWKRGARRAVLVGSDCPSIDSRLITEALEALRNKQLVLGPTEDGGYYLIGSTNSLASETLSLLLTDIAWGTSSVLKTTIDRGSYAGVTMSTLKKLYDIDLPQDLEHIDHHSNSQ